MQTESLFADQREPFFNSIDPKQTWKEQLLDHLVDAFGGINRGFA